MNKSTGVATQVSKVTNRRTTPYLGEQDTAQLIHSSKTHRSMSDAFRDADYATPIWRCETESDRVKEYLLWGVMWAVLLGSLYLLATCFEWVMR
jgi:hypothetical protein